MKLLPLLSILLFLLLTVATSIKTSSSAAVFSHRKINLDDIPKQQKGDAVTANTNHQLLEKKSNVNNAVRAVNEFGKASSTGDGSAVGGKKDLDMGYHHSKDAASWIGGTQSTVGPSPNT